MILKKFSAVYLIIAVICCAVSFTACTKKTDAPKSPADTLSAMPEKEAESLPAEVQADMSELLKEANTAVTEAIKEVKTEVKIPVKTEVKPQVKAEVKNNVTEAMEVVKEAVTAAVPAPAAPAGNRAEIDQFFKDYETFIAKAEQTTGKNTAMAKMNLMSENADFSQKGSSIQMSNAAWTSADMAKFSSLISKASSAIK